MTVEAAVISVKSAGGIGGFPSRAWVGRLIPLGNCAGHEGQPRDMSQN